MAEAAPEITELSWGQVSTTAGTFRDAKLWPGGGRGWDWNETGTSHEPGIRPADVSELLDHDPQLIVLGCGQERRLGVMKETLALIEQHGATVEVLESRAAVERYNTLAGDGRAVAALIHSTC
ncbi:MAG: Mth938-like domain-containing protein [Egibacteraceae bacterium]